MTWRIAGLAALGLVGFLVLNALAGREYRWRERLAEAVAAGRAARASDSAHFARLRGQQEIAAAALRDAVTRSEGRERIAREARQAALGSLGEARRRLDALAGADSGQVARQQAVVIAGQDSVIQADSVALARAGAVQDTLRAQLGISREQIETERAAREAAEDREARLLRAATPPKRVRLLGLALHPRLCGGVGAAAGRSGVQCPVVFAGVCL